MAYSEFRGNIFASKAQTLVNTVNCVGAMGKGVALEFRRRYPNMFEEYRRVCAERKLLPGQILPYRKESPWIMNFAVKDDWRYPSRMEWVESCLRKFVESYRRLGIESIAFPWIGAMNGKLPWDKVHALMRRYLEDLPGINIEVIEFDASASDPLFEVLKQIAATISFQEAAYHAEISESSAASVFHGIVSGRVTSMATITSLDRLGDKTIDRIYSFAKKVQTRAILPNIQSSFI